MISENSSRRKQQCILFIYFSFDSVLSQCPEGKILSSKIFSLSLSTVSLIASSSFRKMAYRLTPPFLHLHSLTAAKGLQGT